MPINKEEKKSLTISVPMEIYSEFHKMAQQEERTDANLGLIIFKLGFETYKKSKK